MDNPPGRYLPANFNIFDFFFGTQPGNTLVYQSNQNLKNTDTKSSINIEDSYYPSKTMVNNIINVNKMNLAEETRDTTGKNSPDEKKSNTRVAGMIGGVFDALTNVVSKITNFTSTINRSLSVTVVTPESFPSEYVVKPLADSENFTHHTDDSTALINTTRRYQNWITRSHTMEAFNNLSPQRICDVDVGNTNNNYNMWNDNTHDYYCQQINSPEMQLAIEENFKVNKDHFKSLASESTRQVDNQLNSQYIKDLALAVEESLKTIKINYKSCDSASLQSETEIQRKDFANKNLSKSEDTMESQNDYVDLSAEQIFEIRSCTPKKRFKSNNRSGVAQSLGKNRRRIPLRRSAAGQTKHKKEKSKNIIYSAIQNDLNTWEDDIIIDISDELCSIISSSDEDENTDDQEKCSLNIENYVIIEKCTLGDSVIVDNIIDTTSTIIKDVIDEKLSENINHSNKCISPITQDYQQNRLPERSVKSENSLIQDKDEDEEETETESVSESESESESEFESESSSDCESEDDDDEDNDFSDDDFIQFGAEISNSTNSKEVRFNLEPTVHTIIKWDFAYRAARKGPWEQMARDRDRFRTRIYSTGRVIEPVLSIDHRDCIWRDRFAATD